MNFALGYCPTLLLKQSNRLIGEYHNILNRSAKRKFSAIKLSTALINIGAVTTFHFWWRGNIAFQNHGWT